MNEYLVETIYTASRDHKEIAKYMTEQINKFAKQGWKLQSAPENIGVQGPPAFRCVFYRPLTETKS